MSMQLTAETDLYSMGYDPEIDAIVFTWEDFATGERFKEGARDLLEFIRERDTDKLIVDTSRIQAHDDDDQQWLQEEWVPQTIDAGIEHAVTVHQDSVISKMDMEDFVQEMDDFEYTAMITADMDEAREWITER